MFNDVMKLIDAGFTKDEIMKMIQPEVKTEEQDMAPEPEKASEPEKAPENNSLSAGLTDLLSEMHTTLKSIQNANIQGSRMPEESREKPEDILASLIYPSQVKEIKK